MELLVQKSANLLIRPRNLGRFCAGRCYVYKNVDVRRYSCLRYKQVFNSSRLAFDARQRVPFPGCISTLATREFSNGSCGFLYSNSDEKNTLLLLQSSYLASHLTRALHGTPRNWGAADKSKVEQTVKALKEKTAEEPPKTIAIVKKPLGTRIWDEILHYYHGFRLLFIDIRVSTVLAFRMLRGKALTRREYKLLTRTVSDVFRLVPFSVFIVVPFMELALPIAIKLFPNLLPSTFQTSDERMNKLKTHLKVKLEVAKFLQDTLDEMSLQTSGDKNSQAAKDFKEFFTKIRTSGQQPTVEETLKFCKLFADELTLNNLPRPHLIALCRILDLHSMGPTPFLTFQIRLALRNIKTDDQMIKKEGVDKLTTWELRQAMKSRGMRAVGVTESYMREQLNTWLDLSINKDIPASLLLLTRSMAMSERLPDVDQLAATISQLPESVGTQAEAKIGEMEGKVDNKIRLQMIKEEEKRIKEEKKEQEEAEKEKLEAEKEKLMDTAPVLEDLTPHTVSPEDTKEGITKKDIEIVESAIDSLSAEKKKLLLEKEELQDLKSEMAEYKEDIEELQDVKAQLGKDEKELRESKAASRVYNKINKMIASMDSVISKVETSKADLQSKVSSGQAPKEELVSVMELVSAMRKMQKVPDDAKMKKIEDVVSKMDVDHDGNIKLDEVVKIFELLGYEDMQITPEKMKEIVVMLEREENLEMEEKLEKMMTDDKEIKPKERVERTSSSQ